MSTEQLITQIILTVSICMITGLLVTRLVRLLNLPDVTAYLLAGEAWYVVRNTPGVTGFIGSSGKGAKPTPLQPYEVDTILRNMGISRFDTDEKLEIGTKVKIVAGPFNGMFGTISMVDMDNQKLELNVDLFGQETSVEVELSQIEVA